MWNYANMFPIWRIIYKGEESYWVTKHDQSSIVGVPVNILDQTINQFLHIVDFVTQTSTLEFDNKIHDKAN